MEKIYYDRFLCLSRLCRVCIKLVSFEGASVKLFLMARPYWCSSCASRVFFDDSRELFINFSGGL